MRCPHCNCEYDTANRCGCYDARIHSPSARQDSRIAELEAKLQAAEAENKRLAKKLKLYGSHLNDETWMCSLYKHSKLGCDCGFEQALQEGGEG